MPLLLQAQKVDALRTLDGQAQRAVPDQLDQRAECAADTEGNRIVQGLLEAVVVEEDTGSGVNVGVRVLGLGMLVIGFQKSGGCLPCRAR